MKVAVFDIHNFERPLFQELNKAYGFEVTYFEFRLDEDTVSAARGFPVVCCFTHDKLNARVLGALQENGTKLVALRSAGFNHLDLQAARKIGIKATRVPAYSPYSVAEHAVALILALNRKLCRAVARVRELNFSLDGLEGFDLHGKTVGVIGAGKIGAVFVRIMVGFGCKVLVNDPVLSPGLLSLPGVSASDLETLYRSSDVISLHLPLTAKSHHLIDSKAISQMKRGVYLVNTGRGGLIDTKALISGLKSGQIGAAGLDVYEEEEDIFFQDLSGAVLQDDVLARLMTFPNVLITAHQAFLTREALHNIVETTLSGIKEFAEGRELSNEIRA